MGMLRLLGLLAALAAADAASACRVSPWGNPAFVANMTQQARERFAAAAAVVEAEAVEGPNQDGSFRMRVIRAYKGALSPGAFFSLRDPDEIVCGCTCSAAPIARGTNGLVILGPALEGGAGGFVPEDVAALYRELISPPAATSPAD